MQAGKDYCDNKNRAEGLGGGGAGRLEVDRIAATSESQVQSACRSSLIGETWHASSKRGVLLCCSMHKLDEATSFCCTCSISARSRIRLFTQSSLPGPATERRTADARHSRLQSDSRRAMAPPDVSILAISYKSISAAHRPKGLPLLLFRYSCNLFALSL